MVVNYAFTHIVFGSIFPQIALPPELVNHILSFRPRHPTVHVVKNLFDEVGHPQCRNEFLKGFHGEGTWNFSSILSIELDWLLIRGRSQKALHRWRSRWDEEEDEYDALRQVQRIMELN